MRKRIDLKGKTIGIVGVGQVGSRVAKTCEILGMKVLLNDPPRERIEGSEKFVPLKNSERSGYYYFSCSFEYDRSRCNISYGK